jgi:hypothetical protein
VNFYTAPSQSRYYFGMTSKKKSASYSPSEILKAQREFASVVKSGFNPYKENQIQMLVKNNKPADATEVLAHKLFNGFTKLHYLFLFSLNSDEDATVFAQYSSVYTSLSTEFSLVERACKKSSVDFEAICSLVMQWTPPYVFNGREKEGLYPWEEGLSELALELRRKYAKDLKDKEHLNVMREHFNQYGIKY